MQAETERKAYKPRAASNHGKPGAGRGGGGSLSQSPPGGTGPANPPVLASWPPDCETAHFCCLKWPSWW